MNNETWDLVEMRMAELRVLTNANWKNSEWELAALGERVLRTVEMAITARDPGYRISPQTCGCGLKFVI